MSESTKQDNSQTNDSQANQPSKSTGQYHSVKGTTVETIGDITGWESWKQSGSEEHSRGEAEIELAKAQNFVEGTVDRAGGRIDAVIGTLVDDRERQAAGNARHDSGKMRQKANVV